MSKTIAAVESASDSSTVSVKAQARLSRCAACPQVKKQLRGGEFGADGYYVATVGKHANEPMMRIYVKQQGRMYKKLHQDYHGFYSDSPIPRWCRREE